MKKVYPVEGSVRTVRRFLWLPKTKMVQVGVEKVTRHVRTPYTRYFPCKTNTGGEFVIRDEPIDTRVRRWWEWASWTEKWERNAWGGHHWSASNWWADMPYEGDY